METAVNHKTLSLRQQNDLPSLPRAAKLLLISTLSGLSLWTLSSCEKEELPVEPYDRGEVEQVRIEMGPAYENQVWFDLGEHRAVMVANRFSWDIAFDCSDTAGWVYLNAAVGMTAAPVGTREFDAVNSARGLTFRADHPSGTGDSLALGRWWESDQVWVLDLGYDAKGNSRGKRKIQFHLTEDGSLGFRYATLNGNDEHRARIRKDNLYHRMGFSFGEGQEVVVEPARTEYDLVFTQYMHVFYRPYLPYLVTGVLLNPYQTLGAAVNDLDFEDITNENGLEYPLSDTADVIGYDWKYYELDAGHYMVFPQKCYIVKDREGFYYKLHFVDFYNASGEKGYPLMEVKKL